MMVILQKKFHRLGFHPGIFLFVLYKLEFI